MSKRKHTGIRGREDERARMNHSKSSAGMQQNKGANLSWFPIGQHKTTLSESGVTNDQPRLRVIE